MQRPPERDYQASNAAAVVAEDLDILRGLMSGLFTGVIAPLVHEFVLECPPKLSIGALS